jgi:hypothetical protein
MPERRAALQVRATIEHWKAHMSALSVLAMILEAELTARGIDGLTPADYNEIAQRLVLKITELDRVLAAKAAGEGRVH